MSNRKFHTVDDYLADVPDAVRPLMQALREAIREEAPDAKEVISYGMPTFKQKGVLVHYAAFPTHIGFYPTPSGIEAFAEELSIYKGGKGSVQFPLDDVPLDLVRRIVRFRLEENLAKKK